MYCAWHFCLGGIWSVRNWLLVCQWLWHDGSWCTRFVCVSKSAGCHHCYFHHLLLRKNLERFDILVSANSSCSGKWTLSKCSSICTAIHTISHSSQQFWCGGCQSPQKFCISKFPSHLHCSLQYLWSILRLHTSYAFIYMHTLGSFGVGRSGRSGSSSRSGLKMYRSRKSLAEKCRSIWCSSMTRWDSDCFVTCLS